MSKKSATENRRSCAVISTHPYVLEELSLLIGDRMKVRPCRLETTLAPDLRKLSPPKAMVYLLDAHLPQPATEAVLAAVKAAFPSAPLVVLLEKVSEANAFPLLRLGAKGILSFDEARDNLLTALETVVGGGFWAPRQLLSRFMDSLLSSPNAPQWRPPGAVELSEREREVLEALLSNLSNKEIGVKLHISERTVKFHVSNLLTKFGAEKRQDLILQCLSIQPS